MAEGGSTGEGKQGAAEVHIVHVLRENDVEPEVHHVRTLASVLGSEEAARESLIYSYKTAISGFSAKLTPQQVDEISIPNYAVPSYNIPTGINSIVMLNDTNFKTWKEHIMLFLGFTDLDLALRVERPTSSHEDKRDTEKWDRSNCLSLMIIKRAISEAFVCILSEDITLARVFLDEIEKIFSKNNKAKKRMFLEKLISMRYTGKGNIREHILEMSHLASKLNALKLELSEDLLVHLVLFSLPAQFGQFRVNCYRKMDNWTLNELISQCVAEEERLKQKRHESAHLVVTLKEKMNKRSKDSEATNEFPLKKQKKQGEESTWHAKKVPSDDVPRYTVPTDINSLPTLNDANNFKSWKEDVMIFLGIKDLDLALRIDRPTSSHKDKRDAEKWDRSNRLSLLIMKHAISKALVGDVFEKITVAKVFLDKLEKSFAENNAAKLIMVLSKLSSMKYIGKGNIRKHILEMSRLASTLSTLKFKLLEDVLVHLILCSLPAQFSQLRVSYNCQGDKWTLIELISYCVDEEERQKQERQEGARLVAPSKDKMPNGCEGMESSCFFCQCAGHLKKDCTKYPAWRAKKGLPPLFGANCG